METTQLAMVNNESVERDVLTVKEATKSIVVRVTNLIVNSPEKAQIAAGLSGKITKAIKAADVARKKQTKPLDDVKKWIKGLFDPHVEQLQKAADIIDGKIKAYYRQEQEKARVEEEKRSEMAKAGEIEPIVAPLPQPQATIRSTQGHVISIKSHWVHRIVNAELVPKEYWVIDEGLIREAVRKGLREIPGVEIWDEGSVAHR